MMNISSIKTHMYCPMKLYIQNHVDTTKNEDFQLAIEIKKLKKTLRRTIHGDFFLVDSLFFDRNKVAANKLGQHARGV